MSPCGRHPQWLHDAADCPFCTMQPRSLVDQAIQRIHEDRLLNEAEQRAVIAEIERLQHELRDTHALAEAHRADSELVDRVEDEKTALEQRVRNLEQQIVRLNPFDHNGECRYCDEQGTHAADCCWVANQTQSGE